LELAGLQASIDVLLQEAMDARRKIIDEARVEASSIADHVAEADGSPELGDAVSRATAIINEAENTARMRIDEIERVRASAEEEAETIVKRAEQSAAMTEAEAERLLDKARLDANSIREETRATQASVEVQLAEIRRLLSAARVGDAESDLIIDLRDDENISQSHHASG
jgi:vacuolar-type H+-ATPase subunit H